MRHLVSFCDRAVGVASYANRFHHGSFGLWQTSEFSCHNSDGFSTLGSRFIAGRTATRGFK
jgi:hypothetical protein